MSYVKGMIIWKGKSHIVEIHGSQFLLDARKDYIQVGKKWKIKKVIPDRIDTAKEYLDFAKKKKMMVSGTKTERFQGSFPTLKTDKQKEKWLKWNLKSNVKGYADSPPENFIGNVIVDLDNNTIYDASGEWYANYEKYLPEGWKGVILNPKKFNDIWLNPKERESKKLKKVV